MRLVACAALAAMCVSGVAQQQHRPPAVPLITHDPFFSLWSMGNKLTDVPVKHWTEVAQPIVGLIRIDGKTYRWMGAMPRYFGMPAVETMEQTSVELTPLHTKYHFRAAGLELAVTFFSPLLPKDLDVMSRPVTYVSWSVRSLDGKEHQADLLLDVDPLIAVDQPSQPVTWSRTRAEGLTVLNVGTRDQDYLHQSGDRVRADWGYFHLAVPDTAKASTSMAFNGIPTFVTSGNLPEVDDSSMPLPAMRRGRAAHLSAKLPLGTVGSTATEGHVEVAYTQTYAIEYMGRRLRPYWQRNGMSEGTLLATSEKEYAQIEQRGTKFDDETMAAMEKAGGADYKYLTSLLFRQTIAAHKLVADIDGTPMFFSKENDSNGCIDTVDVTYPSSPFFLLFNPKLLEAQLEPVMRYSALPRWRFPFAPHDLGTYPLANGQVYGGGEENEEDQMPVEESGNLIIMVAAMERAEGNWDFAKRFMPQLTQWADYLEKKGMDPENQLSTDDFAGHLAHNTNLSIKAIEALGAFVEIARGVGDAKLADKYAAAVKPMPAQWEKMALDGDHYKLAFDQPGTWSQKYNLVWDDLLGLHLFPKRVMQTEWSFYSKHMEKYGLPLDNRKTITKLDWEVWTASLASTPEQYQDLIHRLVVWADETPSRVPTTDWYDTISGKQMGFQARSVVGGVFIKALMAKGITH
ncbi:glutaminase family protein [Edaphobacter sp. 12200R-103]|uniref:glutaminase family protein n=1 Tax=Edaphobacter sp. 12200R-103 TaxID=2703788 RepID=UPI00138B7021|nr:glutaminase family protein [Edaphobacter sp. 12200R-103]QHS52941.1 DUF4965 domain-containing protein [Edaphobacter sp. 12200R-103]